MGTFKMTTSDLIPLIGTQYAPDIVDVCLPEDHALDPRLIPGAHQMPFQSVLGSDLGTTRRCIVVCQKGFKLSQGTAAKLCAMGRDAAYLEGGMVAWAQADLPLWPTAVHLSIGCRTNDWVMPQDLEPKYLFAAWMVMRWVDPAAQWLFVDRDQMPLVCEKFGAQDPLAAMDALLASDTILAPDLRALHTSTQDPTLANMLQGACKIAPRSAGGVESVAVIFDALWAAQKGDSQ